MRVARERNMEILFFRVIPWETHKNILSIVAAKKDKINVDAWDKRDQIRKLRDQIRKYIPPWDGSFKKISKGENMLFKFLFIYKKPISPLRLLLLV